MKKAIFYIFEKWWIPIIFCIFTFIFFIVSVFAQNHFLDDVSVLLLGFALLLLVFSTVYQGIKRKWWKAILTFLSFFGMLGALFIRSEEHTSELQSRPHLVCRLLLEKKTGPKQHSSARY